MSLPSMLTQLHVIEDGKRRYLRDVDVTHMVLNAERASVREVSKWEAGGMPLIYHLFPHLTEDEKDLARNGKIALPKFTDDLNDFWCRVPTKEARASLLKQFERARYAGWDVERAKDLQAAVAVAKVVGPEEFSCFYLPTGSGYEFDLKSAAWKQMGDLEDPRSLTSADMLEQQSCPFVFGTKPIGWRGIEAEEIEEVYECDGEVTISQIEGMIENALCEHHDDAHEQIHDPDELYDIIEGWVRHLEAEKAEDYGLEEKLKAWNEKQDVTSYLPDQKFVVPLSPQLTQDDLLLWCEKNVQRQEAKVAALLNSWKSEPEETHAPAMV